MADICCTSCGYVAQYEDVSDGDFDVENSMCYPCSVAEEENESAADEADTDEEWEARLFTHTDDGRRFATRIMSAPFRRQLESVADNSGNVESDPAWRNALNDGIVPCLRVPTQGSHLCVYEANAINRQQSNAQYLFREIDLRGVGIQQQKLGYRKAQVKEFPQFVKGALNTSPIMCGGGGGSGGTM